MNVGYFSTHFNALYFFVANVRDNFHNEQKLCRPWPVQCVKVVQGHVLLVH